MWFIISADYSIQEVFLKKLCLRVFRVLQHKGRIHPCQDIFPSFRGIQDPPVEKNMSYFINF